jgi:hypothetical protein
MTQAAHDGAHSLSATVDKSATDMVDNKLSEHPQCRTRIPGELNRGEACEGRREDREGAHPQGLKCRNGGD